MPVTAAEVAELRAEGQARGLSGPLVLETTAELIGFMVAEARTMGLDETEMLNRIELVARAAEIDRQELRTARDTLRALSYSPSLSRLLTRLAKRAKPKETWSRHGPRALPDTSDPQRDDVDRLALKMWQPKHKTGGRR